MNIVVNSNVHPIISNEVPTIATLPAGHYAFGMIDGEPKLYGNPTGTAIVEFTPDPNGDVVSLEDIEPDQKNIIWMPPIL